MLRRKEGWRKAGEETETGARLALSFSYLRPHGRGLTFALLAPR